MYPSLDDVTRIEVDGRDVVVSLSRPAAFLPEDLEIPLEFGRQRVGTGPYEVVGTSGTETTLRRFDRYRGGTPTVQAISVRAFPSLRPAWASLLRGDVDMITDVPPEAVEFVANSDVQVIRFERRYQYLIAFNASHGPLSSPHVRLALNLAVDRDALVARVLRGHGTASSGPIWSKFWARDNAIGGYEFAPTKASVLLDQARLTRPGTTRTLDAVPARFHFTCLVPAGFSIWERLALEVQRSLFNIGVDMQVSLVPIQDFSTRIAKGDFDAVFLDMVSGPTPSRAYIFWRSPKVSTGLNVFGYDNPVAEGFFDALRESADESSVRLATRSLQQVFLEDPPALFLAWNERARAVRAAFRVPTDQVRDPLASVWRWTVSPSPGVPPR
jgi:peptide/nickel transport system substrate-binding protein